MRLTEFYSNVLHLTDQPLVEASVRASEFRVLKRGELLIRQGHVPTHLYFLLKGIVRGFFLDVNGRDITDCIVFRCGEAAMPDNDIALPASIHMEALEDCQLVCIALEDVRHLLECYPAAQELYRRFILHSAALHRNLKIATYQYTAVQRYQWFLSEYPGLIERIPHKYVASLLNMTPVTLSKMRKILKENGGDALG